MWRIDKKYKKFDADYLTVYPHHAQYPYNYCASCRKIDIAWFNNWWKNEQGLPASLIVWIDGIVLERVACQWHAIKLKDIPHIVSDFVESERIRKKNQLRYHQDMHLRLRQYE